MQFDCSNNSITSLDVSHNTFLTEFYCYSNSLTSLNVKNGNNIHLFEFLAQSNPALTCIQVDDVAYSNAHWTNKDAGASFNTDCTPPPCIVNIPDANFKNALLAITGLDANHDGEIQCSEADAWTGAIDVSNKSISDLTGIEAFTHITNLNCSGNSLNTLSVSANTALTYLNCNDNSITSLILSGNTALTHLECDYNSLTSLDVSANIALTYLECWHNNIANLNINLSSG